MPGKETDERLRLWLERAGPGFRLRDTTTNELLPREDPRIRVIKVAGVSFRLDDLQDPAFAAGRRLALVPEPANEHDSHAVGIWDAEQHTQAGYVPAEIARELVAGEWQAVVLAEFFDAGKRAGLRVLLAPRDAWIGVPRA